MLETKEPYFVTFDPMGNSSEMIPDKPGVYILTTRDRSTVIAEGVEKQEQLEYLVQHECDKIQGYLYSKPVPEAELIKLLEKG